MTNKSIKEVAPPQKRLFYLDFLRASMMFLGVLVHASHSDLDLGDYRIFRDISGLFRMACFYIISGYFSAMLFERYRLLNFIRKRVQVVFVPAIVCVLFLVPITNTWMKSYFYTGKANEIFLTNWMGHAWFLFVLTLYTLLFFLLRWFINTSQKSLENIFSLRTSKVFVLIIIVITCIFLQKGVSKFSLLLPYHEYFFQIFYLLKIALKYAPYFMLGIAMYLWRDWYHAIIVSPSLWAATTFICVTMKVILWNVEVLSFPQAFMTSILDYTTAMSISFLLFSITARFFDQDNLIIRLMSESSYTVYVVHYIIIAFLLIELQKFGVSLGFRFFISSISACILGVLFHYYLVAKFPVLSYLFNGRSDKRFNSKQLKKEEKAA